MGSNQFCFTSQSHRIIFIPSPANRPTIRRPLTSPALNKKNSCCCSSQLLFWFSFFTHFRRAFVFLLGSTGSDHIIALNLPHMKTLNRKFFCTLRKLERKNQHQEREDCNKFDSYCSKQRSEEGFCATAIAAIEWSPSGE